jgi:hypothetical protein
MKGSDELLHTLRPQYPFRFSGCTVRKSIFFLDRRFKRRAQMPLISPPSIRTDVPVIHFAAGDTI